jgi:zinc protease
MLNHARRVVGSATRLLILAPVIFWISACQQTADQPDVHVTTLDNGLRVIVREDHRAPVVVSQIWYKVGGSYEPKGLTGISHVLEHMMFKGTENYGPGEFSKIIAEEGGRENAFTGRDYTAYFQRLERSRLPISFKLESDRMRNLRLLKEEFSKEIKVVMEERRLRTEDQPESLVYERLMATAFQRHPYHNPVIGWMDDLESMRVEDLQQWYQRWYAPNNATLVVVGDVDPDEVVTLARKFYGVHQPVQLEEHVPPTEPQQTETRRVTVKAPAEVPYILIGFHAPAIADHSGPDWEPYALEVLAGILDGGNAARLPSRLVRARQIAAAAGVSYNPGARSATLFLMDANPRNGHSVEELEAAMLREIEDLQAELVTDQELARVKTQVVASDVYERDSIFYQAMKIGLMETVGLSWREVDRYVQKVRAVTAEQVRAVARKYLIASNMTVAVLEPQAIQTSAKHRARQAGKHGH